MWFGSTTRNARLELTVLIAECQTLAGDWRQSRLDLDDHLGNNGGAFDWQGEKFNLTAEDLRLEGTTLSARLQTRQFEWLEASTDLNYYVINEDGHLMIVDHWGFAASLGRNAVMDGGVLHAEYFTSTGEIQESSINLDDYIGNSDGVFHWGSNNFSATAQNIRLEGAVLHARLATCDGEWRDACTNLQPEIRNMEGNLQRVSSYFRATKVQHPDSDTSTPRSSWPPHLMEEEARRQRDNNEVRTQDDRRQALSECLITRELYQYDPLRKETNIRLLKLEPPGQDLDVIACSLVEVELGSAERFAALSYTWGSPFPPTIDSVEHAYKQITTILCNGNRMHIKQNLYDALRRLRDRKRPEKSQASSNGIDLIADVQSGTFSKVEDTLRLGADVKVRDSSGRTALHFAAKLGHLDMAKALVTAGSDIHALCRLNKRPLDYAKEGRGPYVESVASFLEEEHKSDHVRHRAHTSLRLEVTAFEYFWVDAICINQADEIEKAAQVSIMGDIYRASGCVNVWLGREFHNYLDSTELLLQGVWRLEQAREGDTLSADSLEQLVNDPVATFRQIGDSRIKHAAMEWLNTLGRETIRAWCRLPHLFHRTWFDRAWILQEALMARDLTIVCGRYIVPWDTSLLMSSIVECCQSLLGTDEAHAIFGSTLWHTWFGTALSGGMLMVRNKPEQGHISPLRLAQWRTECQREGRLSMVSALSLSRNQKATDARDKVFCVLAFSPIERKDDHGIQSIRPDYSLSLVWLYIDVAKSLLAVYGPCILSLGGLSNRLTNTKLPSWVPDLDSQLTSRLRGINVRQLHHTSSVTSSIGKVARNRPSGVHITSQNELVINCHLWDVVAETAHSGLNEMGRNLDGLARWLEVLSKLDATLEQRRHALLCSLAERPYVEHFNGSHFEDWLQFLCFTRIVGQSQVLRDLDTGFPFGIDDTRNRKIEEGQKPILSSDTMKRWSDKEAWGPGVTLQHRDWYMDMTRDAMHYGQMLRDNNPTRRLLRTALTNMLGTGPEQAQAGDVIVLVDGVNVPYLLRRARDGKFELIGEVYIHDLDVEGKLRDARSRQIEQELCIV